MVTLSDVLEHGDPDRPPRRRLSRRWAVTVGIGVLLAGDGFALARWSGSGGDAPRSVPLGIPTASPPVEAGSAAGTREVGSARIAAGDQVELALVPGGAWLSSWARGTLTRVVVDGKPRVTTRVRIGRPDESVPSMVYGGRSLWVVNTATNSVVALDPVTGRLQRHRKFGHWGVADTVAFGANSLWVACSGQIGDHGPRERVLRVDPATLRVVGVTTLPGEGENLVVVADDSDVWVGGATPLADIVAGGRTRVTSYAGNTLPLAVNGGILWTGSSTGLAARDAHSGRKLVNTDLHGPPSVLAVDPSGRAWTPSPSADHGVDMIRPTGFLYRFGQAASAGRVDGLAVDDVRLWMYTGTRIIVFDIGRMSIS